MSEFYHYNLPKMPKKRIEEVRDFAKYVIPKHTEKIKKYESLKIAYCVQCGTKLSRYNKSNLCYRCQDEKLAKKF